MSSSNNNSNDSKQMTIAEIKTQEQFVKCLKDNKLTVIDFYATWCGPCKVIAPKFAEMSQTYTECAFFKINADNKELTAVCKACTVTSLPTFCFFKDSKCIKKIEGANESLLRDTIEKCMNDE